MAGGLFFNALLVESLERSGRFKNVFVQAAAGNAGAALGAVYHVWHQLKKRPRLLLIDGNRFIRYRRVAHRCIVQGDAIYASIAAASILAKTWRDEYMKRLHEEFPLYNWDSNKGYGTREHRDAIEKIGLCKYHRKSFNIAPFPIPQGLF